MNSASSTFPWHYPEQPLLGDKLHAYRMRTLQKLNEITYQSRELCRRVAVDVFKELGVKL